MVDLDQGLLEDVEWVEDEAMVVGMDGHCDGQAMVCVRRCRDEKRHAHALWCRSGKCCGLQRRKYRDAKYDPCCRSQIEPFIRGMLADIHEVAEVQGFGCLGWRSSHRRPAGLSLYAHLF